MKKVVGGGSTCTFNFNIARERAREREGERRVNKTSSMFEQFKVLAGMIEKERKGENDDRTEYDPCENNEYKDTLKSQFDIETYNCKDVCV